MPIIARSIVTDAAKQLQDDTNVTWPLPELLKWLNMGRRQICVAKPDSFVINKSVQLAPGTKQSLPADGNVFMRLTRNMGTNGSTPGRAITPMPIQVLDEQNPNWHFEGASATALHFAFDPRDQKTYYVYPAQPATGNGQAEIIYGATPPDVTLDQPIGISDLFEGALLNFVLSMAYGKDSQYTRNDEKSAAYLKRAGDLLAGMTISEKANDASTNAIGNQRAIKAQG